MGLFDFLKKPKEAKTDRDAVAARLFDEVAIDDLVKWLTRIEDPDEVLKKAGVSRNRLSAMLYDDEIGQACETRLDALLTVPYHIYPSTKNALDDKSDALHDLIDGHIHGIQTGAWQARLFGYSVIELVYRRMDDGVIGISFAGEKPMEWFEPRSDGRLMFYPSNGAAGSEGIEVDQEFKFFLTRCKPTYKNPFGEALLSRLYWAWYFRGNGWKFWGKFLERFGQPLLVGKSSDPTKMVNALLQAHHSAVVGVGRDDDVNAVGVPAGNSGQTFDVFEMAVVRRIQKMILGQTLSSGTDGGSGNRALGQVHDIVRMDKRDSDIRLTQPTVQRVIDALCKLNGWGMHTIELADGKGLEKDRATRDKDLYAVGVRFTRDYIADSYDLDGGDFTLTSDTPTADAGGSQVQLPLADSTALQQGAYLGATGERHPSHLFGKRKFTPAQQAIEDLAGAVMSDDPQPLDTGKVRDAILMASDPEDLVERLFAILGPSAASDDSFRVILERALYAADVIGYVAAAEEDGA